MKSVFIDTSAFVALRNSSEAEHERARAALADLISEGVALFTSNYVFAETYTALMVRVGRGEAIEWGRRFRDGGAIDLVHLDRPTEERAWEILERYDDKRWSYVDATSFALLERDGGESSAFAFDAHFSQRGLQRATRMSFLTAQGVRSLCSRQAREAPGSIKTLEMPEGYPSGKEGSRAGAALPPAPPGWSAPPDLDSRHASLPQL